MIKKITNFKKWVVTSLIVLGGLGASTDASATNCPGATPITPGTFPITGTVVVGNSNDLNSTTIVAPLGSNNGNYLGGNEALHTYTPAQDQYVKIDLTSDSTWTSIWVFKGCPTAAGSELVKAVTGNSGNKTLNVGLTGGQIYYIVFDTYPSPPDVGAAATYSISQGPVPQCANLSTPSNGAVVSQTPTLAWSPATDADGYKLFVGADSASATQVYSGADTSYTYTTDLAVGNYVWYVVPFNGAGDAIGCGTTRAFTASACQAPTNVVVADLTPTSATVSWTAPSPAPLAYEYIVSTTNTPPDANTTPSEDPVGTPTVALTALTANTTYYVWVRSRCSMTETSAWTSTATFTTPCVALAEFCENFDAMNTGSTFPDCWIRATGTGSGTASISSTSPASGTRNVYLYVSSAANAVTLIAPPVSNIDAGTHEVKLKMRATAARDLQVGYITDVNDLTTFVALKTFSVTTTSYSADSTVVFPNTVPAGARIAVRHPGTVTGSIYFDDFCWLPQTNCDNNPSAGTASNITLTTATASWGAATPVPASGYDYYLSTSSTTPLSSTTPTATTTDTFVNLTGLTASTSYYVFVRSNCGGTDGVGNWVLATSLFTGYCQPAPTSVDGIGITNVTMGTINNTTTTETNNYGDYSAQVTDAPQTQDLAVNITFQTGFTYNTMIWVDWNDDLVFDSTEVVATGVSQNANPTTLALTFNVPSTAALGNHRLRIGSSDGTGALNNPCYTGSYGSYEDYTINVTPPPPCLVPSNLAVSDVTLSSATITWNQSGSSPENGYDYYYSTTNTAPDSSTTASGSTATATDTTVALTGLTANTNYYVWVKSKCANGNSAWSPAFTFFTGYCQPAPTSVDGSGITNVTMGTINNTTTAETNNYGDYSAQVTDAQQTQDLAVNITFQTGYTYNTMIWVDWNDDLVFDSTEVVATGVSQNANPTTLALTFNVPATATLGNHRLRIGSSDGTGALNNPCYTGSYGSYEDYTINVTPPPPCVVPNTFALSDLTLSSATITWNQSSSSPENGYDYYYSTTNTAPDSSTTASGSTATAADTTVALTGLTANTNYYVWVKSKCANGNSTWSSAFTFFTGYCQPAPTSVDGDGITNVTMGTINNTTTTEANNYGDYSAQVTDAPQTQDLAVNITFQTGWTYNTMIWVDWNDDLVFDSTEVVATGESQSANPTTLTLTFNVPATATLGNHRLRIGSSDGTGALNNPCYTGSYGSYEDYTINVVPPSTCIAPTAVMASSVTTSSATVSWTAPSTAPSAGYEYYYSTTNTSPTDSTTVSGTTAAGVTTVDLTGLSSGTSYYVWVRSNCGATDGVSLWSPSATFETGRTCSNGDFYDNGGASGNYANGTNEITTICPDNSNDKVKLKFLEFNTEKNYDGIKIFDGPDTTSTAFASAYAGGSSLSAGSYHGSPTDSFSALNKSFVSTHSSGCITVYAKSDGSVNRAGWHAKVSCCGTPVSYNNTLTACESYQFGDTLLTATGTYTRTLDAADGCDSVVTLNLTINPSNGLVDQTTSVPNASHMNGATHNYFDNSCKLIATIQATGGDLGNVSAQAVVDPSVGIVNGQPYLQRHYEITATNPNVPTIVTLYFKPEDFTAYNNGNLNGYPALSSDGNNIRISAFHSAPNSGGDGPNGHLTENGNVELIIPNSVTFNTDKNRWEVVFNNSRFSGFYGHTVNQANPLSIDIETIAAKNAGEENHINWNTSKEELGDVMVLQRSDDNSSFSDVATIKANGYASEYNYVDANPRFGKNYYRVLLTNNDGIVRYSKVVTANVTKSNSFSLDAIPNPTKKDVLVRINGNVGTDASIILTDITGKVLTTKSSIQGNTIQLDLERYPAGIYFVKYADANRSEMIKVIKK